MNTTKVDLTSNLNVDPRLIGLEPLQSPGVQFNSSQRMQMSANKDTQCQILDGAEMPIVSTGFDKEFMMYSFNTSRFEDDGVTYGAIPKYKPVAGISQIISSPTFYQFYKRQSDGLMDYVEVPTYIKGLDGFGYLNHIDQKLLQPNISVRKDQTVAKSNAIQGSKYCLGTNTKVAYISMKETDNDAFVISESLAKKMTTTRMKSVVINISRDMVPLNLYGNEEEYKFMPDIGEKLRNDGIICALRKIDETTFLTDTKPKQLLTPQILHDNIYMAEEEGATIIDIEVYMNDSKKVSTPIGVFAQARKYKESYLEFCRNVLAFYTNECVKNRIKVTHTFASLIERCANFLSANKEKPLGIYRKTVPKLSRKMEPIEYIQIVVTYMYKQKAGLGSKLTDKSGGKGVVSAVK